MTLKIERKIEPLFHWISLIGHMYIQFVIAGTMSSYGLLYLELEDIYNEGPQITGLVATIFAISITIVAPVTGVLNDFFGPWKVMCLGALLGLLGNIISAFSHNISLVCFAYGVFVAVGINCGFVTCTNSVASSFMYHRTLALGITFSGGSVGTMVYPLLFQAIVPDYTARGYLLINGGLFLNFLVVGILIYATPKVKVDQEDKMILEKEVGKGSAGCNTESITELKVKNGEIGSRMKPMEVYLPQKSEEVVMKEEQEVKCELRMDCSNVKKKSEAINNNSADCSGDRNSEHIDQAGCCHKAKALILPFLTLKMLSLQLWHFTYAFAVFGYLMYFPPFAKEMNLISLQRAALVSIYGATDLLSGIFVGVLGSFTRISIYALVTVNMIIVGVLTLLLPFLLDLAPAYHILIVHTVILGLLAGGINGLLGSIAVDAVGTQLAGTAIGLCSLGFGIAVALPPIIYGALKESTNSYIMVPYLSGAVALLCAVVVQIGQIPGYYRKLCCRFKVTLNIESYGSN